MPSRQRCLSASITQEKEAVTGETPSLRSDARGGVAGGWHVATVKKSVSLRTKNRGNVPPRFETL